LKEVISQVHGTSGIKMIKAIISGNRDKQYLLSLCDKRIINKKGESVLKALEANYNDTYLFMLEQNLHMWEKHQDQLTLIDKEIEKLLEELCKTKEEVEVKSKAKLIRHPAPGIKNLHAIMVQMCGMNVSSVSGINDYTLLRLMGETGINMNRFPNIKHFVSWCGLSPKHHDSGKTKKRVKGTSCNKAGQIFKESAQGLLNSKYVAIGSFMRKLKAKKDSAIAIKARARKLAEAYFNALTKGINYVEQGTKKYEEQIMQREKTVLYRLAKKHNMQVTEKQQAA
jgi:hypothetical protein